MNKKSSFKEEEQRTAYFLEKLEKFKKSSKKIKEKSKFASHQLEWSIQFKNYLKRE